MSREIEEWRDINGYEGLYQVSDWGNVRSVERSIIRYSKLTKTFFTQVFPQIIKKKHYDKDGYEMVNLKKDGKHETGKIHRLVAEAFIPNPDNKPCVDHINGVRNCNFAWNLRWVTQKENLNTPLAKHNISQSSKIKVLRRNRNNLGQFVS